MNIKNIRSIINSNNTRVISVRKMSKLSTNYAQKGSGLMSIAGVEKVKESEMKAEDIRKQADEAAKQIAVSAKKEAADLIELSKKEAEDTYKAVMKQAEVEADSLYQDIIDAQKEECKKIKEDGQAKIDEVVDNIVRKVVGIYGNS